MVGEGSFVCRSIWGEGAEDGLRAVQGRVRFQEGLWDIGCSDLVLQPCRGAASVGFHSSALAATVEVSPARRATQCSSAIQEFCLPFGQLTLSPFYFSGNSTSSRPPNSHLISHPFFVHVHLVGLDLRGIFQP